MSARQILLDPPLLGRLTATKTNTAHVRDGDPREAAPPGSTKTPRVDEVTARAPGGGGGWRPPPAKASTRVQRKKEKSCVLFLTNGAQWS